MKKLLVVMAMFVVTVMSAYAENSFQLGLVTPIQIVPEGSGVDGVRLGLIYTKNSSMKGLDMNWIASHTTGRMEGVQVFGLVNIVEGGGKGLQVFNFINYDKGNFEGFQLGTVNFNESIKGGRLGTINYSQKLDGGELGFINVSKNVKGFQFGIFNYTEALDGIQIGFVNVYTQGKLPVLPIINANF